jgi:hypothetical protein
MVPIKTMQVGCCTHLKKKKKKKKKKVDRGPVLRWGDMEHIGVDILLLRNSA